MILISAGRWERERERERENYFSPFFFFLLTLQFFPLFTSMLQCLIFSCWIIHSWSDDTLDDEEFSRPISVEMPKSSYAICGIRCSRVGETAVRAPLLLNPKDTTSSRQQEGVVAWVEYQKVCSNYRSDDGLIFLINCVRRFFIIAPAKWWWWWNVVAPWWAEFVACLEYTQIWWNGTVSMAQFVSDPARKW
jgi:hypothetical protein